MALNLHLSSNGIKAKIYGRAKHIYSIYEKMTELDVPAMIHVSGSCHHCFDTTGSYYLGADTTAFQHLMMAKNLFRDLGKNIFKKKLFRGNPFLKFLVLAISKA